MSPSQDILFEWNHGHMEVINSKIFCLGCPFISYKCVFWPKKSTIAAAALQSVSTKQKKNQHKASLFAAPLPENNSDNGSLMLFRLSQLTWLPTKVSCIQSF